MLKTLSAAGVVAAATMGALMFATPANADVTTSGDSSILGGNQVLAPISVPINVCGNAVAVIGGAGAGCKGGAKVANGASHS